jgi:hypothetical protein
MAKPEVTPELQEAMWAGDVDRLHELAPCVCCCEEHTFGSGCPAYAWGGCRGQGAAEQDHRAWAEHYRQAHGMTSDQFYGVQPINQEKEKQ